MKSVCRVFVTGLMTVLPVVVTLSVLWWIASSVDGMMSPLVGEQDSPWVSMALSITLAVVIVFAVGVLMNIFFVRAVWEWAEKLLNRLPLVKTLYGSVRDLMGFFGSSDNEKGELDQVVMVKLGDTDLKVLGLLTRDNFSDLPPGIGDQDTVAVYLPMSYQIGGFTTMVPRSSVEPVDMSTEDAMRFAVTAGMTKKNGA